MEESKIVIQDHELNDEELDGISGGADQGAKKLLKPKDAKDILPTVMTYALLATKRCLTTCIKL